MSEDKKAKLEKAGWVETTVAEFLNLDEKDQMIVELRAQLSQAREALESVTAEHSNTSPGYVEIHVEALGLAYAALAAMKRES